MTVDQWVAEFARSSTGRSPETLAHTLAMVRPFQVAFERTELRDVSRLDARRWCAEHPSSARYVRLLFAEAVRAGLVAENPFARPGTRAKPTHDHTPPSGSMLARITAEALPAFRDVIAVAAGTGLRATELAHVHVLDVVRVPALRVRVRHGKNGRTEDYAPVLGVARPVVEDLIEYRTGLLLQTVTGRAWTRRSIAAAWRKAADACGFGSTFHCTRRYFATRLIDQGASYQDVAVAGRWFDAHGRPNIELVARLYGHPSAEVALGRIEALA
jgi:integrase